MKMMIQISLKITTHPFEVKSGMAYGYLTTKSFNSVNFEYGGQKIDIQVIYLLYAVKSLESFNKKSLRSIFLE